MTFAVDMHVHTTAGSADSNLRPAVLRERLMALGLDGVQISEHFRVWTESEAYELAADAGFTVFRGMEWNTELGHILALGVESYRPEIRALAELRRFVDDVGGLLVAAHPFRHAFDPIPALWKAHKSGDASPEAACRHPVFEHVHAVEVLNGACTERENALAAVVAERLGLPGIGGSDAHYVEDLGRAVTVFDGPVRSESDLIAAILSGCARAAAGPAATMPI